MTINIEDVLRGHGIGSGKSNDSMITERVVNIVTASDNETTIYHSISSFNKDKDILKVYQENLLLYPNVNYTLSSDGLYITLLNYSTSSGEQFMFEAWRRVKENFSTVSASTLTDGSITSIKLADGAITSDKLNNNAVTTSKIADASISTAKIADNAITGSKIANNSITTTNIVDSSITTSKILDDSITDAKLASSIKIGSLSSLNTANKTNVVAAINELFQSASDGKSAISQALTGLGVSLTGSETFTELALAISNIETGSGSYSGYGNVTALVDDYTVASGENIYANDVVEINQASEVKKAIQKRITNNYISIPNAYYAIGFIKLSDTVQIAVYELNNVIYFKVINFNIDTHIVSQGNTFDIGATNTSTLKSHGTTYQYMNYYYVAPLSSTKFLFLANAIGSSDMVNYKSSIRGFIGTYNNGSITFGSIETLYTLTNAIYINKIVKMSDNKLLMAFTKSYTSDYLEVGDLYLNFIKEVNGSISIYKENKLTNPTWMGLYYVDSGWGITFDKISDTKIAVGYLTTPSTTYVGDMYSGWTYSRGAKRLNVSLYDINSDDSITAYSTYTESNFISNNYGITGDTAIKFEMTCLSSKELTFRIHTNYIYVYLIDGFVQFKSSYGLVGLNDVGIGWQNDAGDKILGIKVAEGKAIYSFYQYLNINGYVYRDAQVGIVTKDGTEKAVFIAGGSFDKMVFSPLNDNNLLLMTYIKSLDIFMIMPITTAEYRESSTSTVEKVKTEKLNKHNVSGIAISDKSYGKVKVLRSGVTDIISTIEKNKVYYASSTGEITEDKGEKIVGVGIDEGKLLVTIDSLTLSNDLSGEYIIGEATAKTGVNYASKIDIYDYYFAAGLETAYYDKVTEKYIALSYAKAYTRYELATGTQTTKTGNVSLNYDAFNNTYYMGIDTWSTNNQSIVDSTRVFIIKRVNNSGSYTNYLSVYSMTGTLIASQTMSFPGRLGSFICASSNGNLLYFKTDDAIYTLNTSNYEVSTFITNSDWSEIIVYADNSYFYIFAKLISNIFNNKLNKYDKSNGSLVTSIDITNSNAQYQSVYYIEENQKIFIKKFNSSQTIIEYFLWNLNIDTVETISSELMVDISDFKLSNDKVIKISSELMVKINLLQDAYSYQTIEFLFYNKNYKYVDKHEVKFSSSSLNYLISSGETMSNRVGFMSGEWDLVNKLINFTYIVSLTLNSNYRGTYITKASYNPTTKILSSRIS